MARIRTVKPEFWTSAQVLECSTNARLMFIGLWNFCDDKGRHPASEKQIKAEVFPADDFTLPDVRGFVDELEDNGLVRRYIVENKEYLEILGWHHQRIDKPQEPKYPAPLHEHSENDPGTLPPDSKGKDSKGRERKDSVRQAAPNGDARFDEFWALYPRHRDKKKAREVWKRRKLASMADMICDDVRKRQKIDGQWRDGYIPLPTTYLNNDRWEDEYSKPKGKKDGGQEWLDEVGG